jgi:hypothetical protein
VTVKVKDKHTPGPWKAATRPHDNAVYGPFVSNVGTQVIAWVTGGEDNGPANRKLIAEAPNMLVVLREERDALMTWLGADGVPTDVREGIHISIDKIDTVLKAAVLRR